jgi:hypothetical protein
MSIAPPSKLLHSVETRNAIVGEWGRSALFSYSSSLFLCYTFASLHPTIFLRLADAAFDFAECSYW